MVRDGGVLHEEPQEQAYWQHRRQRDPGDDGERDVPLGEVHSLAVVAGARGGKSLLDATDDGADDLQEGPYRGDSHGSCADEANFGREGGRDDLGDVALSRDETRRAQWHEHPVGDDQANDHGGTDGHADEVADADQGEGERATHHRGARAEAEVGGH